MKTLFLIRHAKSSWKENSLSDFERPLNKRGKKNAPFMGKVLKDKKLLPDLIISSTATRAMSTAKAISKQVGYPEENIQPSEAAYHASVNILLHIVNQLNDDYNTVFLFGHNPGMTEFSHYLTGSYIDNIPTAGIVRIDFEADSWREVSRETGELVLFDYPKRYPEMQ